MSDYTRNYDFSVKDALATGDPLKLIVGSEVDSELDEIATAVATKYDSSDLASQAQAEAEASNAVLLTPLRLANWSDFNAGVVGDLQALAAPGADRLLFWDHSALAAAFLTLGTGLSITDTTLAVSAAVLDHDALLNFVADEHVAHSSITFTAGEGLTGGGTLAANRSFALSISGLTAETTLDIAADYLVFYDASASAHRKVLVGQFVGDALGDGKWYKSAATTTGGVATVTSFTEDYNTLVRGTFSTAAGTFTAGANGARILVGASFTIQNLNSGSNAYCTIQVDGVDKAKWRYTGAGGAEDGTYMPITTLSLSANQVVRFQIATDSAESIDSGIENCYVWIVELG